MCLLDNNRKYPSNTSTQQDLSFLPLFFFFIWKNRKQRFFVPPISKSWIAALVETTMVRPPLLFLFFNQTNWSWSLVIIINFANFIFKLFDWDQELSFDVISHLLYLEEIPEDSTTNKEENIIWHNRKDKRLKKLLNYSTLMAQVYTFTINTQKYSWSPLYTNTLFDDF